MRFETPFGPVHGEIIFANIPVTQQNITDAGITIRVKQIAVTKSLFGYNEFSKSRPYMPHGAVWVGVPSQLSEEGHHTTASFDKKFAEPENFKAVTLMFQEYLKNVFSEETSTPSRKSDVTS